LAFHPTARSGGAAPSWRFAKHPQNRSQSIVVAFREGLAAFGWVEGRNLRIDFRFAGGDPSAYAEELVNLRPDVIFALTGPMARAVQPRGALVIF
jgi:putative tryptophan/tyrosine transport system substrate-binding protein